MTIVELTRLIFALFQSILNASFEIKRQDFYVLIDRRSHTNALIFSRDTVKNTGAEFGILAPHILRLYHQLVK